jgi:hypothetical protein
VVFESEILPLLDWLFNIPFTGEGKSAHVGVVWMFLLAGMALVLLGTFFGYLTAAIRVGPFEAFYVVAKVIATAIPDLVRMSPRRIGAMSWLAIKEAVRNRVLVAFAVFAVILLIGSWYLDSKSDHPATLYLSVVLTATNYLTILLGLFLSGMSLPTDIKNRTIYTIVTKPVRSGEIVLGRVIGFGAIGTAILVVMYAVSFVFVYFGLRHTHEIDARDLVEVDVASKIKDVAGDAAKPQRGESTSSRYHRHTVTVMPDGTATTDSRMDHKHPVRKVGEGADAKYVLDPPTNNLPARVPHMGELEFVDRTGSNRAKKGGVNVGDEWAYRSYVEGGTLAAAVWKFKNVTPERFPDGLPLELTIRVFRTHKANIERRVTGSIEIRNPNPKKEVKSAPFIFESEEYSIQEIKIPRKQPIQGPDGKRRTKVTQGGAERDTDLFLDLVENGEVEVWLSCADPGQYFGMAQPDVYLRRADGSFALNLLKGYYSIWLQMMLVICFGVTFSTILSGAVAMLATVSTLLVGYFSKFIVELFTSLFDVTGDNSMGGGPIEALIRIVTQKNLSVDLDLHWLAVEVIRKVDFVLFSLMWLGAKVLPDFGQFDTSEMVATGYDVFGGLLLQHTLATAAYVAVLAVLGYFFLRTREIAA